MNRRSFASLRMTKSFMKKLIQTLLASKARRAIRKYKPKIIAVTGSVGKTSTRNAIAAILSEKFRVGSVLENYNNEFGVPLAILGEKSPGKSALGWLRILLKCVSAKDFPQVFVLEYGADHRGDISHLCDIAVPDVAVLTALSPVHVENFASFEELIEEKAILIDRTTAGGLSVLNADDERVMALSPRARGSVSTYGFGEKAHFRAENFELKTRDDFSFEPGENFGEVHFDLYLSAQNQHATMRLENHLSRVSVSSALAALAIGMHFDLTLDEIIAGLKNFAPQTGRMRPLPGIKGCLLLDDSYNAAPASMRAALEVLFDFSVREGARRIAALGSMAELGRCSEEEHRQLGERAAKSGVDLLVTVGEPARDIDRGAAAAGLDHTKITHFDTSQEAGRFLDSEVKKGDVVLIKGSQSARMERVTKDLMAEPLRAGEFLVRQSEYWMKH